MTFKTLSKVGLAGIATLSMSACDFPFFNPDNEVVTYVTPAPVTAPAAVRAPVQSSSVASSTSASTSSAPSAAELARARRQAAVAETQANNAEAATKGDSAPSRGGRDPGGWTPG